MAEDVKPPGTIENGVLVGRDGYLFLAEGGHAVSDFVTGRRQVAPVNFDIFRGNISSRMAWAVEHGARYLHLIMPDKQSIIPEAWTLDPPIRLGELYARTVPDLQPLFLYPADLLARQGHDVLTRTDTHLAPRGSLLIAALLAEGFTREPQTDMFEALAAKLTVEVPRSNDLGDKLTPAVSEIVRTLSEGPPGTWVTNKIPGGNNGGVDLRFNPQAPYQKCVAFFGDSFGRDVATMLQFWFSEVYFFRTGYFHPEIAAQCGPDIVITETVERYLNACLDDENRPHFLLYPHLGDKSYEPSLPFTKALSAVLNFPRAPYANYVSALGLTPRPPKPPAPVSSPVSTAARPPALDYDDLLLTDPPDEHGLLQVLEAPRSILRAAPALAADLSGRGLDLQYGATQHIHGSYLVQRHGVLLFGANHLVDKAGLWSCEARQFKQQFIDYYSAGFFDVVFPGAKPSIRREAAGNRLVTAPLAEAVTYISAPVFLATPLEPSTWGRWIATVAAKIAQYRQYGAGRQFFCHAVHDWQRAFLRLLGVPEAAILAHDPGRTYICRDVMTVEYSMANMSISAWERANFYEIVALKQKRGAYPRKLFVSRLARSKAQPHYRVLQNEAALAAALEAKGFATIEPETLPFAVQIGMFAAAEQIVFIGGSGVYNAVFCPPGSSVITIESTNIYTGPHTELFASLGLRHGVIFGAEDASDPQPEHRRWTLDITRAVPLIEAFFGAGD